MADARILSRDDAARYCGYEKATDAFDAFARDMGFRRVPGRRGCYDRRQIDAALDAAVGLGQTTMGALASHKAARSRAARV